MCALKHHKSGSKLAKSNMSAIQWHGTMDAMLLMMMMMMMMHTVPCTKVWQPL
jgi:hypothetical protein